MKSLKYIRFSLCVLILSLATQSCSDYLEYNENKNNNDEIVWNNFSLIKRYLTSLYEKLPNGFNEVGDAFLDASTDNAEHLNQSSSITKFNMGTWDAFDNPNGAWEKNYTGLRMADTFIAHADTASLPDYQFDMTTKKENLEELFRFRGEARFLKAFFYFELMKRYGEVPIVEQRDELGNPVDNTRQPISEVVSLIAELCDSSIHYLPTLTSLGTKYKNNLGRPFQGTAYALKSRAFLYAGSPSYNGGSINTALLDSCAKNSAKIFTMGYSLQSNYADLFAPDSKTMMNNYEVLLDIRKGASTSLESMNFPIGFYSGDGLTNPTQDLVDAYEFTDGSNLDWNAPDLADKIYLNRDKRFYATILYNGAQMQGRTIECFEGGKDATRYNIQGTRTGYYLKKYVNTAVDLSTDAASSKHYWPVFRYAEILLNYAEAMNEINGPSADPSSYGKTALAAVNEVRQRAGLAPLALSITQDELRQKIRNERRVEFAFEGHRHWDVRRWKVAENTLGTPINGVKITRSGDEANGYTFDYSKFEVENRVFESKMYFYPVPNEELLIANPIEQTPGW